MATIKQTALTYESKTMKNVADLSQVSTTAEIIEETFPGDKAGEEITVKCIEVNGEKYRVPNSVLKDLKAILEIRPDLGVFRVKKEGTGLNTNYTVIPLD